MGHALNNTIQDILDPLAAHAGLRRPLDARHRPRRHRHPGRRREGARRRRGRPATTSAARSSSSASGRGRSEYGGRILGQLARWAARCDWDRERFTLDDGLRRPCADGLLDLFETGKIFRGKRLVNWDPSSAPPSPTTRSRTSEVNGHLWTIKLPGHRRRPGGRRRHDPPRDDARRHRRRRPPRRRALRAPDRQDGHAAAGRTARSRSSPTPSSSTRVRHRRVKVTPGARPQRLPDRPRHGLPMINVIGADGTYDETPASYAGPDPAECASGWSRTCAPRPAARRGALHPHGPVLPPLAARASSRSSRCQWFCDMSPPRPAGDRRGRGRAACASPRPATPRSTSTGWARSATGASAASSGGATAPGLVPRRRGATSAGRAAGGRGLGARPRRPRHLVQLGPLAVLDPRLARADARAGEVLPDERPLDGPRHHHPLGRPDGDHGRSTWASGPFRTSTSTR